MRPLVVLEILEMFRRRKEYDQFIIGTLVGERDPVRREIVIVKDVFIVPHTIDDNGLPVLDIDYHRKRLSLLNDVSPSERVVGWFATPAPGQTIAMHRFLKVNHIYQQEIPEALEDPFVLTIDTNLSNNKLSVRGYKGRFLYPSDESNIPSMAVYDPVDVSFNAQPEERVALDSLINSLPDNEEVFDSSSTLLSQSEGLDIALNELEQLLETVQKYVETLSTTDTPANTRIGREISRILHALPNLSIHGQTTDTQLSNGVQDLLMVIYLANLVKAQTCIADKVNLLS